MEEVKMSSDEIPYAENLSLKEKLQAAAVLALEQNLAKFTDAL